jgi:RimJ/RimL family protein N-acetyltransferase
MRKNVRTACDWRTSVPELSGELVTLRELRDGDAPSLLEMLATDEVSRFISPPPPSIAVLERFIAWARRERAAGNHMCFAVVPRGMQQPIGVFQLRRLDTTFETAEWGFAIGSAFWGTGVFVDAATALLDFAFDRVGVHRLEARAVSANGRGNGALAKLGARREGTLRQAFRSGDTYLDQSLWTILAGEWRRRQMSTPA